MASSGPPRPGRQPTAEAADHRGQRQALQQEGAQRDRARPAAARRARERYASRDRRRCGECDDAAHARPRHDRGLARVERVPCRSVAAAQPVVERGGEDVEHRSHEDRGCQDAARDRSSAGAGPGRRRSRRARPTAHADERERERLEHEVDRRPDRLLVERVAYPARGAVCPRYSPAATASTPNSASAPQYAANGVKDLDGRGHQRTADRVDEPAQADADGDADADGEGERPRPSPRSQVPVAASATLKSVSEVASLMVAGQQGHHPSGRRAGVRRPPRPRRRAVRTQQRRAPGAAANESDGCTSTATSATARAVTSTSPTPSRVMAFQDERKSRYELDRAAEYSSGGNSRTTCASISNRADPGRTRRPADRDDHERCGPPLASHRAATSTAAATRANTWTWCTGRSCSLSRRSRTLRTGAVPVPRGCRLCVLVPSCRGVRWCERVAQERGDLRELVASIPWTQPGVQAVGDALVCSGSQAEGPAQSPRRR